MENTPVMSIITMMLVMTMALDALAGTIMARGAKGTVIPVWGLNYN